MMIRWKTMSHLAPAVINLVSIVIIFSLFWQKGCCSVAAEMIPMVKSGCPARCGNVNITYPFGVGDGCYLEERFNVTCRVTSNSTYPLLLGKIVVTEITLENVFITHNISEFCYRNQSDDSLIVSFSVSPFSFSHDFNKFVAIGSDIFAFMTKSPSKNYTTGCASLKGRTLCREAAKNRQCTAPGTGKKFQLTSSNQYFIQADTGMTTAAGTAYPLQPNNPYQGNYPAKGVPSYGATADPYSHGNNNIYGKSYPIDQRPTKGQPYYQRPPIKQVPKSICYGIYCCETSFPYDIDSYNMQLNVIKKREDEVCGYAFIAQKDFSVSYNITRFTRDIDPHSRVVPAVLEWAVGNTPCPHAEGGGRRSACGDNSICRDSPQGLGYICECRKGYKGNPYLRHGCQDVDECAKSEDNDCHETAICKNYPAGNYTCTCPDGYRGDPYRSGCLVKGKIPLGLILGLGIGIAVGLLILLASTFWLFKRLEKRKKDILKRRFFDDNGGRLLRHMMALSKGSVEKMKLYMIEDLEKATDSFSVDRILGKGGFGTVYKGMLQDGSIVAVKKSDKVDEIQVEQFVNEVFILSQIDHGHIVKLLGCCLETEVPLLVYEHVSNGTLSHHLHDKRELSWESRLRIATEIADALDYLHSYGSAAIFHRDIKSNNVLLDENLRAIVADFGISRPVLVKKTHLTASVLQGTYGYLDPEYFQTYQFTGKSDVYAFGVLLAELNTGEKAISLDRNKQGLASHFTSAMNNNELFEIVDQTLVLTEDQKKEILVVAGIAKRCLEPTGNKRPTMKEVARELKEDGPGTGAT